VPFLDNEHTRASLPLKLYEYLAAGLPVVARDLPNLEELAAQGLVRTARDGASFGAAVSAALRDGRREAASRVAEARRHGWSARIEELRTLAGEALRRRDAGAPL